MKSTGSFFRDMTRVSLLAGILLAAATASTAATLPVNLGSAGNYTILAKSGISTVGTTSVVGNLGISPNGASSITGFGLIADPSNQFSTSSLVYGRVFAANYAPPTPANLTTAISDMQLAYSDAAGRAAGVTGLGAGSIGGMTLAPNVYQWGTGVLIGSDLFLAGTDTDVWIFQIAQTLDISSGVKVVLSGGAQAKNIFWQVAGQTTLGTTSVLNGNVLDATLIAINTGARLNGKALAQTAVTLQAATVISTVNSANAGQTFAFPSPDRGNVINFAYNMAEAGKAKIRVYNENGDLVASIEDLKTFGPQRSQIPTTDFAPGIYIYKAVLTYDSGREEKLDLQKFAVSK